MAAREYYSAEVLTSTTVTSNTVWGSTCPLSCTLASGADYIVFWSLELGNTSNTSADAQCQITVGGTAQASFNAENRNTAEMPAYAGFFKVTGTGSSVSLDIQIKAETNGNNIVARNRRLTVIRMGSGDAYAESTARQAITAGGTTTWANVLTLNFTPAAGNYLLLGHSMTDNYATTPSVYAKFVWDGTAEANTYIASAGHAEIAAGQKSIIPLNKQSPVTVSTGGVSRSVVWQGRSNQNGMEAGFAQNRLLVLRLDDFPAAYTATVASTTTASGATETSAANITQTTTANPHFIIGSWYGTSTSNVSAYVYSSIAVDSTWLSDSVAKAYSTNSDRGQSASFAGIVTPTAGSHSFDLSFATDTSQTAILMASSAFAVLDLGSAGSSVNSTPTAGSITTAGYAPTATGATGASSSPAVGSITVTGYAPTVGAGAGASSTPTTGSVTTAGYAPTVAGSASATSSPAAGSITTTGYAPVIAAGQTVVVTPDPDAITLTGHVPTFGVPPSISAREYYSAETLTSSTFTSNSTWGTACTLSPTLASGADYIVFWSLELTNQSNTTADAQVQVTVGGTAQATMNAENRNTAEFPAYAGFFKVTGTGSPLTIALEVKAETNGNNIVTRNRRLTVLRMGDGDVYTESTARQAVTAGGTSTFANVLSTTFTPDVGDYLVLGHSATDNYATTVSVYGRFSWDGTAEGTTEVAASGHADITTGQKNLIPLNKQRVYSEATGGVSRTVIWQGRSHQNGNEVGFAQNRLLILRLADFSAYYPARLSEIGWVEGDVATDVLAISPTVTANPHLLLASWSSNNVSNSTGYVYSRLDDDDDDNDAASSTARVFNVADTRGQGAAFAGVRTYTAGTRPISLKVWGGAAEWSSAMGGSAFTLLDLGALVTSVPANVTPSVGSLTLTGYAPFIAAGTAVSISPTLGTISLTGYAPSVLGAKTATTPVDVGSLLAAGYAPSVVAGTSVVTSPSAGSATLTGYAPSVLGAKTATTPVDVGSLLAAGYAPSIAAGTAVSISPTIGSVTLTGYAPTVLGAKTATTSVGVGSLTTTGYAPSVSAGTSVVTSPSAGSATLTGYAPSVLGAVSATVAIGAGAFTTTGYVPVATAGLAVIPAAGALTTTGYAPSPSGKASVAIDVGVLATTGHAPTTTAAVSVSPTIGSISLLGYTPTVLGAVSATSFPLSGQADLVGLQPSVSAGQSWVATPAAGTLTIIGFAPDLSGGQNVTALPITGNVSLSGMDPILHAGQTIATGAGQVVFAGFSPSVIGGTSVSTSVSSGSITVVGYAPTVSAGTSVSIAPAAGALALTAYGPSLIIGQNLSVDVGSITLVGYPATIAAAGSVNVSPATGSISLTGYSATPTAGVLTSIGADDIVLTGLTPAVSAGDVVAPQTGSLSLVGLAPSVSSAVLVSPATGTLALTGQTATAQVKLVISVGAGSVNLSGNAPSLSIKAQPQVQPATILIIGRTPSVVGGTSATVQPPPGSIILAGAAPAFVTRVYTNPQLGVLSVMGFAPDIQIDTVIGIGPGAANLSGKVPTILIDGQEPGGGGPGGGPTSKQVVRQGDSTSHGGQILTGSTTYKINGKDVARVGDQVSCPVHGNNTITTGSATTFVDGQPVAIVGSLTACGATITSGSSDVFNG